MNSSMTSSASPAIRSTMWLTLIEREMWLMKKISHPTQTSASAIAPVTVATGTNGCGNARAAGNAAMQYVNVPRKTPSVPCVVRSLTKLIRMRGENCVDASVSVISRIANTIDTTVMIEVAILLRITCATPGSSCEGKRVLGIQALIPGIASSSDESTAPAVPRIMAMANGRMRKPPRSAYIAERNSTGKRSNIGDAQCRLKDIEGLTRLGQ